MDGDEESLREAIVGICRALHARDMLAAGDGNVSARLPNDRVVITPAGRGKAALASADMALLAMDGEILAGRPSTERLMHLAVYARCPAARFVVHAHPPTAIAWTLARPDLTELPCEALPEVILAAGRIPVVPYARPGTAAMGDVLLPFLPAHRLLLLARHGALCWGEDAEEVRHGMERLEHVAAILLRAEQLGGAVPMPEGELAALRELRARGGDRLL